MSLSDSFNTAPDLVPAITCPSCGSDMRLATIIPESDHRDRMRFECTCGFDYT
jgi:transposase-like protein